MKIIAGIDVSKQHLDVSVSGGSVRQFANTREGIKELLFWLPSEGTVQGVCEATGVYQRRLVEGFQSAGLGISVLNPAWPRRLAQSEGCEAKTDKADAQLLCRYGELLRPALLPPVDEKRRELGDILDRRRQLVDQRTQESNRLEKEPSKVAASSCQRHIRYLDKEIKRLEKAYQELVASDPDWGERAALYESVPGIGRLSAAILLAELPELGELEGKLVVSLAGLAPWSSDSGGYQGKRSIKGGRHKVRDGLYMAALSAKQHNRDLRCFYERLRSRGKPGKVALVAVMRKLLLLLHAVAKRGTPWVENHQPVV